MNNKSDFTFKLNSLYENDKFLKYYDFLVQENKKYNLTAITEKKDVYIKHFFDSLALDNIIELENISLCDVGSGAGFPGIPIKISYPSIHLQIVEPTLKRVNFMRELIGLLDISNVAVENSRAEDCARVYWESFDVVTARAVASLPILLELLVGFVKVGGYCVLYKGDKGYQEITESKNALDVLGCAVEEVFEYDLPDELGKRMLIKIKKLRKTDLKYPRRYSEIKKKPL